VQRVRPFRQPDRRSCFVACIYAIVTGTFGSSAVTFEELLEACRPGILGTENWLAAVGLADLGWDLAVIDPDLQAIIQELDEGRAVVVVRGETVVALQRIAHAVVATGFADESLRVMDPRDGEFHSIGREELDGFVGDILEAWILDVE
jgi:hypothetical protein